MPSISSVLVIGGGIGGLTLATALGTRGIHADVIEIKPEPSVYGVGIIQPGNALRALNSLGLARACIEAGFPIDEYRYFDSGEHHLATLRLLQIAGPDMPATNMLPRPALHRILTAAAEAAGAKIALRTDD